VNFVSTPAGAKSGDPLALRAIGNPIRSDTGSILAITAGTGIRIERKRSGVGLRSIMVGGFGTKISDGAGFGPGALGLGAMSGVPAGCSGAKEIDM